MNIDKRTDFHQQVVESLLDSKAIDLERIGSTMSKFGERAIRDGFDLVQIINRNVMWNCGWPGPELDIVRDQFAARGQVG